MTQHLILNLKLPYHLQIVNNTQVLQNYSIPYKYQQSKIGSFNTRSPLILDILLADISVAY